MIPLQRPKFPSSKDELIDAIDAALRRYVGKPDRIVTGWSRVFPYFDEIAINFDGTQLDRPPPPPPIVDGQTKSACEAARVTLSARNLSLRGAPADLQMEARDVVFHHGRDATGDTVLIVHKVRDGSAVISATQLDLEKAITQIGGAEARKRGVGIGEVRLAMRARGARSLFAEVRLQARKFLLRANIEISGQIDVDDNFVAKLWNLKCKGDGTFGALACNVLTGHLRQLEGRTFPLQSLPLGQVQLRDVRVAVADSVAITVDFGSST